MFGPTRDIRKSLARYAAIVAGVAAITAVLAPFQSDISILNVALIYLVFAVPISARWGLAHGLFFAMTSIVALDFFFVPPVHGLAQTEPQDLIGLSGILIVSSLTGTFLSRARGRQEAAELRGRESGLLYELSTLIVSDLGSSSTLVRLCERVQETFAANWAAVFASEGGEFPVRAATGNSFSAPGLADALAAGAASRSESPEFHSWAGGRTNLALVSLRHGGETLGVLGVQREWPALAGDAAAQRLLRAFGQVAALALYHTRLMAEVTATRALQEADVLKSALLASVSHELRTPLGSIKASITSLLEDGDDGAAADREEFLETIDHETDRLTRIVSNLLDLSRIEGGALKPVRDWFDVREFLDTVVGRLRPASTAGRVSIECPASIGGACFDYLQLAQVLTNLIENAAKFSPAGSPIRVTARRTANSLRIAVSDEGPGIPDAERERVFDRFFRGSAAASAPGSGLGLTISRGLVEAHGGRLELETAAGGGATFTVTLPVLAQLRTPAGPTEAAR